MKALLPVMFGYFIMGLVDVVGIATNYVKSDFTLSDTLANIISISCFIWFLVISIPTGMLMNRIGRKKTVLSSYIFTFIGLGLPLISYSFETIILAFALVGIGNAMIQVALNPLVSSVVTGEKLTGTLTIGQAVKAVASICGPLVATWCASTLGDWKLTFAAFAVVTMLSGLWLLLVPIQEQKAEGKTSSFFEVLSLLGDARILFMFIGILVLVGVDVGINTTLPKYFMEKCGMSLEQAGPLNSVYFAVRTIAAFIGGAMLMKVSEKGFFKYSVLVALIGLAALNFAPDQWSILGCIVLFGAGYANLFSIIFSLALKTIPEKANEISSLLIVGVSGGAVVTPLIGVVSDSFHTQVAAIAFLTIVWLYMIYLVYRFSKK